jgi:hypothetical protein
VKTVPLSRCILRAPSTRWRHLARWSAGQSFKRDRNAVEASEDPSRNRDAMAQALPIDEPGPERIPIPAIPVGVIGHALSSELPLELGKSWRRNRVPSSWSASVVKIAGQVAEEAAVQELR